MALEDKEAFGDRDLAQLTFGVMLFYNHTEPGSVPMPGLLEPLKDLKVGWIFADVLIGQVLGEEYYQKLEQDPSGQISSDGSRDELVKIMEEYTGATPFAQKLIEDGYLRFFPREPRETANPNPS